MDGGRAAHRPDADLVCASLRGEKDAFAVLVTRHWHAAAALAARVLGSADLGKDAVQEATIVAMSGLDQLRSADRFGAWFCGITLNVARRWLRQLRAERRVHLPDQASPEPGPQELAELFILVALRRGSRQYAPLWWTDGIGQAVPSRLRLRRT